MPQAGAIQFLLWGFPVFCTKYTISISSFPLTLCPQWTAVAWAAETEKLSVNRSGRWQISSRCPVTWHYLSTSKNASRSSTVELPAACAEMRNISIVMEGMRDLCCYYLMMWLNWSSSRKVRLAFDLLHAKQPACFAKSHPSSESGCKSACRRGEGVECTAAYEAPVAFRGDRQHHRIHRPKWPQIHNSKWVSDSRHNPFVCLNWQFKWSRGTEILCGRHPQARAAIIVF